MRPLGDRANGIVREAHWLRGAERPEAREIGAVAEQAASMLRRQFAARRALRLDRDDLAP
jgi:hypothetical protein